MRIETRMHVDHVHAWRHAQAHRHAQRDGDVERQKHEVHRRLRSHSDPAFWKRHVIMVIVEGTSVSPKLSVLM